MAAADNPPSHRIEQRSGNGLTEQSPDDRQPGRDPEVRYTPNGNAVCNVSVHHAQWKNKDSGERQEETEWHRVVSTTALAEIAGEYLKKGRSVYVEGRPRPASGRTRTARPVHH